MFKIPGAVAPYVNLIKWALIGIILSSVFIGGCNHGKNESADKLAKKDQVISEKNQTIADITRSLNGAAKVFKKIEEEADRRIAADKKSKADAKKAGEVAQAEKLEMQERIAGFSRELEKARRKPKCKALLDADLEAICEL